MKTVNRTAETKIAVNAASLIWLSENSVHAEGRSVVAQGSSDHSCRTGTLRSKFAGNVTSAQTSSSTPLTTTPNNRNGIRTNHTSGYKISANKATGQQSTSRMHQSRNLIIAIL